MPIFNTEYKSYWEWKPWANTMFYIPFKSDSLDHSGNWITTSWWGTITYQNPWALITDSFYANYTQNPSSFTVSVWCKSPNSSWNKSIIQQAYIVVWSYNWWDLIFQNDTIRVEFLKPSQNVVWQQAVSNVWVINWHLVTLTVGNWTTWNVYIDWELKMTHSVSWYNPYQIAYQMGQASTNTYLWDVILENKVRTAQKIADYYNNTKSNYWL
jgi:hypothetical protein